MYIYSTKENGVRAVYRGLEQSLGDALYKALEDEINTQKQALNTYEKERLNEVGNKSQFYLDGKIKELHRNINRLKEWKAKIMVEPNLKEVS